MTPIQNTASLEGFSALLRRELHLDAPRIRSIARIATGAAIAVTAAMVFQIPLPAYIAYLIFLLTQEDTASTIVSAVGGLVAVTLAVGLSLLFYILDASEPALRIPLLALSTFIGIFLSRTTTLGPIAFLAGFILVLSQTLIDGVPSGEVITHVVLWLWVVVATPVFTVVVLNLLVGQNPVVLAQQRAASLMDAVADYIEYPLSQNPSLLSEKLLDLNALKAKAFMWDKTAKAFATEDQRLLNLLLEILQIARALPPELGASTRRAFAQNIRHSRERFLQRRGIETITVDQAQAMADSTSGPVAEALGVALQDFSRIADGGDPPNATHTPPHAAHGIFVPDAFANRAYARHAFKVTLAALSAYAIYSLLDWPGISTAVTTCFFVSLGTFGESVHKLTLRLSGAVLGGLLGGLCLVFVLPSLTDIGHLCLLIGGASVFFAWVSTSSENISYAGMQMAFAFFLGVLQGYSPASDLTVLRDRVAGILLGNVLISVFFSSLWPVSALQQTRNLWSSTLEKLGALLIAPSNQAADYLRLEIHTKTKQAALLKSRSLFEGSWMRTRRPSHTSERQAAAMERLVHSAFVLRRLQASPPNFADALTSKRLTALSKGEASPSMKFPPTDPQSAADLARLRLNEEIDHATRLL